MDKSQTVFLMHIMDGYSFRNAISIIKSEINYASMIVSEKLIEISFANSEKRAIHKFSFFPQEFSVYHYNIRDDFGELMKEYPIGFDTNEFYNTTKGIGRRDGIRIYWLQGENSFNVQPIKTSIKDPGRAGALFVKILNIEHVRYDTTPYNKEPNVRVQAKDFSDICTQAITSKCISLDIIGHESAVSFKGLRANQSQASFNRFTSQTSAPKIAPLASNISEIDNMIENLNSTIENYHISESPSMGLNLNIIQSEDLMTVKLLVPTMKALSKIHNISPPGTQLKFTFEERKPTKIESPIGTYGLYVVCLR